MTKSEQVASQEATPKTTSKGLSAYDANFEQILADYGISNRVRPLAQGRIIREPENLAEIRKLVARPRPSVEAHNFTEQEFTRLQILSYEALTNPKTTQKIFQIIEGMNANENFCDNRGSSFTNLSSMTNELTVKPMPDLWDGVDSLAVNGRVRSELNRYIIPTTRGSSVPIVPNFFFEGESPSADHRVTERQVLLDGAYRARASKYHSIL